MILDIIVGILGGVVLAAFATAPIAVAFEILKSRNRDTPTEAKYFFGTTKSFRFFQEKPAIIQDKEAFLVAEKHLQFAANYADNPDASVLSKRQGMASKSAEETVPKSAEDAAKKATEAVDQGKKTLDVVVRKSEEGAKQTADEAEKAVQSEAGSVSNEGRSEDETFVSEATTTSKEDQKEDEPKKAVYVYNQSPIGT